MRIKKSRCFFHIKNCWISGNLGNALCNPWPAVLHGVLLPVGRGRQQSLLKFDNWDFEFGRQKVMDLLALGNSAANFLLYCIMSTQVPCHTYHHSSHSCLRGQFRKTIRKMLGIKKRTSTSTSVTVTTKLEVKYLFDSANCSDVVVVCAFNKVTRLGGWTFQIPGPGFKATSKIWKGDGERTRKRLIF